MSLGVNQQTSGFDSTSTKSQSELTRGSIPSQSDQSVVWRFFLNSSGCDTYTESLTMELFAGFRGVKATEPASLLTSR